jgi:EF-hand fold domain/STATa Immunoglobulin-like domain/SH2 domain/Dictyostelium STAT, coiled coil
LGNDGNDRQDQLGFGDVRKRSFGSLQQRQDDDASNATKRQRQRGANDKDGDDDDGRQLGSLGSSLLLPPAPSVVPAALRFSGTMADAVGYDSSFLSSPSSSSAAAMIGDGEVGTGNTADEIVAAEEAAQMETARARALINQAHALFDSVAEQLHDMFRLQRQLVNVPVGDATPGKPPVLDEAMRESGEMLLAQQVQCGDQIEGLMSELHELSNTVLLEPIELHHSRLLSVRLRQQLVQVNLLRDELRWWLQREGTPLPRQGGAALIMHDPPVPQVVFKGKVLEDAFELRLLESASRCSEPSAANGDGGKIHVRAELVCDESQQQWSGRPLLNSEAVLDAEKRSAHFPSMKVNVSTRMSIVHARFTCSVSHPLYSDGKPTRVTSESAYALIVITNESQWCDAEGKLVLLNAFTGQRSVSFALFANAVHHHFLKSTRQAPLKPNRGISRRDMIFFHERYFASAPRVNQEQAREFWGWFGPIVQTLRFKRHINSLWFDGLIYGVISKEQCNRELLAHTEGTFLIRFSETYPGLFAVAYVSDDPEERIKHYLVKPEDTGSQKTLPDFLREKAQFRALLKVDPSTGELTRYSKDAALQPYYSKDRLIHPNGYVRQL